MTVWLNNRIGHHINKFHSQKGKIPEKIQRKINSFTGLGSQAELLHSSVAVLLHFEENAKRYRIKQKQLIRGEIRDAFQIIMYFS